MNRTLAILGAGELGKQIAHLVISDNIFQHVVFFDDFETVNLEIKYPVLGNFTDVKNAFKDRLFDEAVIAIGYKFLSKKKDVYLGLAPFVPFATIIHSTCWVDSSVKIGDGTVLYPCCCIDKGVVISSNTILNLGVTISHDSVIGSSCFLAPSVVLSGFVQIGECNFIGANSTIIDSIKMKNNVFLGAGSLVLKDIIEEGKYVGNPLRKIK